MKFGPNVLQVHMWRMEFSYMKILDHPNMHQLLESHFRSDATLSRWQLWHYFTQKSAAIWSMQTQRASTSSCSI